MTIPKNGISTVEYRGDGATSGPFGFSWHINSSDELGVTIHSEGGQKLAIAYSVATDTNGGTVTFDAPPPSGAYIILRDNPESAQLFTFPTSPEIEQALDYQARINRRALGAEPLTQILTDGPAETRAGRFLGFGTDGQPKLSGISELADKVASSGLFAEEISEVRAYAQAAMAAFANFQDKYLGEFSADPTTDIDGSALDGGELYFSTSSQAMKIYSGGVWRHAYVSAEGALLSASNLSDLANAATARANLGLGSVDNTRDVNKPVSTPQQNALNAKLNSRPSLLEYSPQITDWNTALQNGWYWSYSGANGPVAGFFLGIVEVHNSDWVIQTVQNFTTASAANTYQYRRHRQNGVWSGWYKLLSSEYEIKSSVNNVVQNHVTAAIEYGATTDRHISTLDTSITTTKANSRVEISANIAYERSDNGVFYLIRNGAEIGSPLAAGSRSRGIIPTQYDGNMNSTMTIANISFMDYAPVANVNTYSFHVRGDNSAFYLNRTVSDTDHFSRERATSTIILKELF